MAQAGALASLFSPWVRAKPLESSILVSSRPSSPGLARLFTRVLVSFFGAGVSTLLIAGPATVQAKDGRTMAAAEMRAAWQRTAATCYLLHEDTKRGSKVGNLHEQQQNRKEEPQKSSKLEHQLVKSEDYSHLFGSNEGWSTINAQYLLDKKPDFHLHATETELRTLSSDCGSEWEILELSSTAAAQKDRLSGGVEVGKAMEKADLSKTMVQGSSRAEVERAELPKTTTVQGSGTSQPWSVPRKVDQVQQQEVTKAWRNADQGELAALIAKSSSGELKNCDLPSNKSRVDTSRSLRNEEAVRLSRSFDSKVLGSKILGEEQLRLQALAAQLDFTRIKLEGPASLKQDQQDQRSMMATEMPHWTSLVPEGKTELLGEALCRSQTRAREAEQRAGEAIKEKEKLLKLFFREASISQMYKHWVKLLQAENRWLRSRVAPVEDDKDEQGAAEKSDCDISPLQQMPINRKTSRKASSGLELVKLKKRKCSSEHSVAVLACTVGLAFALGVGLAGAGIFLGCTVGHCLLIDRW